MNSFNSNHEHVTLAMNVRHAILILGWCASATAQVGDEPIHGRTTSENVVAEFVPGTPDPELRDGTEPRFEIPRDARPAPMPQATGRHRGPNRMVEYDVATGIERELDLPDVDLMRVEEWLSGRMVGAENGDPEALGSLLPVTPSYYPWTTHCRIFFEQGGIFVGSGVLLDAQTVLTAGHIVHSGNGGVWSQNVLVAPAFDGDWDAFGFSNAAQIYTFTGWTSSGDRDYDMGFIRLQRPVGYLTGWLGTFYNTSNSFWANTSFVTSGYPAACFPGAPRQLYTSAGKWDKISTNRVEANLSAPCWIGGMSGGGVYYVDGAGKRFVGATNSYAYGSPKTTRIGCNRMTQPKFDALKNTVIPAGLSKTTKDLVPLRARTGNTTIRRGLAPISMTYNVFNHSLYNPASATTTVNVYLSTDPTITTSDTLIQTHNFTYDFGVKTGVTIYAIPPPVIPAGTAPGMYYVGILITSPDANNANNATNGWDAQLITVTL